jgi:hypothetical protein
VLGGLIPGFATGTSSAPRGIALVGERGPELVRFKGGERVSSTHDTLAALRATPGHKAPEVLAIAPLHFHAEGAVMTPELLGQANAYADQQAARAAQWGRQRATQDRAQGQYAASLNA